MKTLRILLALAIGLVAVSVFAQAALPITGPTPPPCAVTTFINGKAVSVTFSCTVSGDTPFSFQWQKRNPDGVSYVNVAGATSSSWTISAVAVTDTGFYRCFVQNLVGACATQDGQLVVTIGNPPTVTGFTTNHSP